MTAPQEPVRDHPHVRSAVFMDEAATRDAIRWAQTYNGYQRLAQDPGRLGTLLEPARHEYLRTGHVPEWCGVDLLRGWAFYLYRADYFCGGGTLDDEWLAVLDALSRHPHAERADQPPLTTLRRQHTE